MNQDEWKSGRVDDVVMFVIGSDITGHSVMLLLNIKQPAAGGPDGGSEL